VYALGGAITESGALSVHNDENLALANFVATGDIVLTGASNQFDLLKFDGVSVNIMENGEMAISSAGSNATTLALRATGNISQSTSPTGGIRVTGATTLDASGAEIMLMGGNNNSSAYSSVNDFATVTIIGANKAFIGDSNAIDIAGATISGGLTATTNLYIYADGNTTQSGAITVANGYALFATGIINSSKAITLNNPANSFAEMVMLYSKAPGTHDLTLYNSFSGGTAVVSATVNRTDSTIGVLTLNVPNSNLQTSFGGMEQPGSAVLIKALNITCGSESFAGNLTQAARPWYVYDSASGAPVITLNVYGSINLTGSVHNRFNKVLILRNGTVYSINTEIPGSSKTGTTTKDNDIVDMNA